MLNFTLDPRLEPSEPFTKQSFQLFRERLPSVTFGTHAGLTILLGYLLDLSARHASVDRWFRCTAESVESDLGLVPPTQQRLLALLDTIGYVEVRHIGKAPPVRYLRMNLDLIEQHLLPEPAREES
ncbi:MAG: hypothetical protein KDA84_15725 [Planctomycetaceae bacterium]|nr:hypothetical protein [Planctomycetaceae bacterium]